MKNKQPTEQPQEVAVLETILTDLAPVEAGKEQLEGDVEKAKAKKLKEVLPELKPLDRKEKSLKHDAIAFVKANRHNKSLFKKGTKSIVTRAGTAGYSKGRPSVKTPRKMNEEALIAKCKELGIGKLCIQKSERFNKTKFRQAVRDKLITKEQMNELGIRITQRESYYVRTKTAKRTRPTSAKVRSRKAVKA